MKKISVITPVYNEAEIIREVYEVIRKVFAALSPRYDYEHIFLDNCSSDETVSILKDIATRDKKVKILVYSRNFGPLKSEMIGYRHADGDAVISFEGNLKDPADLIPVFIKYWEEGYDVVYGERTRTQDMLPMRLMRKLFYRIIRFLSNERLPLNAGNFRLTDRRVVNELVKIDDYKPYIRGLITSVGFKQKGVQYKRNARPKGRSKSSIGYLIDFAINAMVSYSITPIRICTYLGLGLFALTFLAAITYIILKLTFWRVQIPALAGIIVLILLLSGMQFFFLGIIGEYVGAIHSQVRRKLFVIIKEKVNFGD